METTTLPVMTTPELIKAILAVMKEVKGIEKNLNVGDGRMSYKGVADQDVKETVGKAMAKHGLVLIPTKIEPSTTTDTWEEKSQYGDRTRRQVFTEVKTTYLLMHEGGGAIEIQGYGHGVDSQDKSAGKATTYALKYALLYTFLVPTGDIDDADTQHSDNLPVSKAKKPAATASETVVKTIQSLLRQTGKTEAEICKFYEIESLAELSKTNATALIKRLENLAKEKRNAR